MRSDFGGSASFPLCFWRGIRSRNRRTIRRSHWGPPTSASPTEPEPETPSCVPHPSYNPNDLAGHPVQHTPFRELTPCYRNETIPNCDGNGKPWQQQVERGAAVKGASLRLRRGARWGLAFSYQTSSIASGRSLRPTWNIRPGYHTAPPPPARYSNTPPRMIPTDTSRRCPLKANIRLPTLGPCQMTFSGGGAPLSRSAHPPRSGHRPKEPDGTLWMSAELKSGQAPSFQPRPQSSLTPMCCRKARPMTLAPTPMQPLPDDEPIQMLTPLLPPPSADLSTDIAQTRIHKQGPDPPNRRDANLTRIRKNLSTMRRHPGNGQVPQATKMVASKTKNPPAHPLLPWRITSRKDVSNRDVLEALARWRPARARRSSTPRSTCRRPFRQCQVRATVEQVGATYNTQTSMRYHVSLRVHACGGEMLGQPRLETPKDCEREDPRSFAPPGARQVRKFSATSESVFVCGERGACATCAE